MGECTPEAEFIMESEPTFKVSIKYTETRENMTFMKQEQFSNKSSHDKGH